MDSKSEVTKESDACENCGNFGALEIGDRKLCSDCVTLAGSACAGSPSAEVG